MVLLLQYRKKILIGLAVLIIAVVLYFAIKKIAEPSVDEVPLPPDEVGSELNQTEVATVKNMAMSLYQDMDGLNYFHSLDIYKNYASFSDTLFVAVYNEFNDMYFGEGEGTLRAWINSEALGHIQSTIDTIMVRMTKLGLA